MQEHEFYMQRALDLAQNGKGNVSPNPLVGCVIVYENKIIGEGWHQKYGEAHAEVNAILSVNDKSLLPKSTLYVTLEPCAHFGKTPPCTHLIINNKIPKVVICNTDPFEKVAGKGVELLKNAQIEVITNILEHKGKWLNRRFFTFIEQKRPYIILKWAQTANGFVAKENFDSKWISNTLSRKIVHKFRTEEDAILVGFNTALYDNPKLNSRDWQGKNPLRIVLDKNLALPQQHYLFDKSIPTICFNSVKNDKLFNLDYIHIDFNILEESILQHLTAINIQSIIIEGGSATLQRFIDKNLWDEARVFEGTKSFENGIKAPIMPTISNNTFSLESNHFHFFVR